MYIYLERTFNTEFCAFCKLYIFDFNVFSLLGWQYPNNLFYRGWEDAAGGRPARERGEIESPVHGYSKIHANVHWLQNHVKWTSSGSATCQGHRSQEFRRSSSVAFYSSNSYDLTNLTLRWLSLTLNSIGWYFTVVSFGWNRSKISVSIYLALWCAIVIIIQALIIANSLY